MTDAPAHDPCDNPGDICSVCGFVRMSPHPFEYGASFQANGRTWAIVAVVRSKDVPHYLNLILCLEMKPPDWSEALRPTTEADSRETMIEYIKRNRGILRYAPASYGEPMLHEPPLAPRDYVIWQTDFE
jgi:hypothetical protein